MESKVCIIGAGSSGIAAAKALKEHNIPYDCFEMGSDIGGNWRYNNDNGRSAAYRTLHIDTSKERMAFSDFPMPNDIPNYPHHSHILKYFDEYVNHFGLRPTITFRTRVKTVAPAPGGGYHVTTVQLESGEQRTNHYRAVLVCNGHHWHPKYPVFPGQFDGESIHSRDYREPDAYKDKNVLVVGIGNSGVDLACDVAKLAKNTYLSTRRGAHILPRFMLGRPTDKWVTPLTSRLPLPLQVATLKLLIFLAQGNQANYGVPKPAHPLQSQHPTMSAILLDAVAHGDVAMKPNVLELAGKTVRFEDGSTEPVDVIIYATGYQVSFPFFDESFLTVENNHIPLYRKVVHPDHPNLFFIGLIQPLGAIMPLAEKQVQWVARLLKGALALPEKRRMEQSIQADLVAMQKRYVSSSRHTLQVDFWPYKRQLEAEIQGEPNAPQKEATIMMLGAALGGLLAVGLLADRLRRRFAS